MTNVPMISLIIPIYNADKQLRKCLDSIFSQTFSNFELICINDGSTDQSLSILQEYLKKDTRIKCINQTNCGQSLARNKGLDIAQGEYIYFVDADDYIHPQALDVMYDVAIKTQAPITVANTFIRESKKQIFSPIKMNKLKHQYHYNVMNDLFNQRHLSSIVWNKLYKREILNNKRFIEGIQFEDWCFITCLFSEISFYASINVPLYAYNDIDCSTVRSPFSIKKIDDYMTGINSVYEYYSSSDKKQFWPLVRKKRIKQSLKMVVSKIYNTKDSELQKNLIVHFFQEFKRLKLNKIIYQRDFSLKSHFRIFKLFNKIRNKGLL